MQQLRLFWAVNLPFETKRKLNGIQLKLRDIPCDVKWAEEENLHFTLKFLGNVEVSAVPGLVDSVKAALAGVPVFTVRPLGMGFFPGSARPRVLWVGLQGELGRLQKIYELINSAHLAHGFQLEKRPFSPHLTLARLRFGKGSEAFVTKVNEMSPEVEQIGSLKVRSVDLMQSELNRRGPVYTPLAKVELAGK
ncbi:MAG TPA: RNA 2',3'-cyclic phosphodiesterase [Desulfotomaculum sp.]|nr:MAG: 2'-5' RNA ligase [Desulfotomaculum sp. 46_80]KUK85169.1 MAG: 2'-5' RNA ligase [Desulfofundulus kuznetsovii]HAG12188.1 RNA 2',3'-cyclic phosphodiesterase [Desulfotomaculum sp.]HBY04392.1 RNA 2',3'-cyclic phosphodiesterase [Desulfotomaculum sp.]